MAQVGFRSLPAPRISWNGDKPEINYGLRSMEQALLQMSANQNARIPSGWLRLPAGQNGGSGSTGGRAGS